MDIKIKKNYFMNLVIFSVLAVLILVFFPGNFSPDTKTMYSQALENSYSYHHPPTLSYIWHFIIKIIKGRSGIYIFLNSILAFNTYLLLKCFDNNRVKLLALIPAFSPYNLVLLGSLFKDIFFTYGVSSVALILSISKNINIFTSCVVQSLILIVCSFKYQGMYVLPVLTLWNVSRFYNLRDIRCHILALLISLLSIYMTNNINSYLTEHEPQYMASSNKKYIYDLSGISHFNHKIIIPNKYWKQDNVDIDLLNAKYSMQWETLVVYDDSPFNIPNNELDEIELRKIWLESIYKYPIEYLFHRLYGWGRGIIITSILKTSVYNNFNHEGIAYKILFPLSSIGSIIFLIPLSVFMALKSYKYIDQNDVMKGVFFINAIALMMLVILIFNTIAFVARYSFFSSFMISLSIPLFLSSKKFNQHH